jgi:CheY-like chemotaxis protein
MKRLVLFVDDDVDVREAYRDLLELNGWEVVTAGDGFEALSWLSKNPAPNVILLDLKMPRCDGYQFRAAQLAEESYKNIPTLVFTGDVKVEGSRLPSLGGAPVVHKSADYEKLLKALDQIAKV